jgi:hypothetical protein
VGRDVRHVTEDKVMKMVAVLCCVVGAGAVLYVAVFAQYVSGEPVDEVFFRKYWAAYVIGMALVWVGAGLAWPRHREPDREDAGDGEEGGVR